MDVTERAVVRSNLSGLFRTTVPVPDDGGVTTEFVWVGNLTESEVAL